MTATHPRMVREQKTMQLMVDIYCKNNHQSSGINCSECRQLQEYARYRLEKCPYQERKTTCANCPTHCYKKSMRDQMREVMAFSGPRMVWRHPGYTLLHLWDGLKKPVVKK